TVAAQPPLEPIGKWDLDYGEAQCIAVRDYGSAENPISFAIRPAPNGETFELLIARKTSGPRFAQELEGSVDFGGGPNKAWLLTMNCGRRISTSISSGSLQWRW